MKFFFLALVCCSTCAMAQYNENSLLPNLRKTPQQKIAGRNYVSPFVKEAHEEKLSGKFKRPQAFNQELVTTLPLNRMPCVVPNMKKHTAMPNAGDSNILKHPIDPGIYAYKRPTRDNAINTK